MRAIERMSGAESAAQIIGVSKWPTTLKRCVNANDEPCKFPECQCAETGLIGIPVLDTMTDDRFNLHRVDASQLNHGEIVNVGGDLPIQLVEPERYGIKRVAVVVLFGLLCGAVYFSALK